MTDIFQWNSVQCDSLGISKGAATYIWWHIRKAVLINFIQKGAKGGRRMEWYSWFFTTTKYRWWIPHKAPDIESAHVSKRSHGPLSEERDVRPEKNNLNQSRSGIKIIREYLPGQVQDREMFMCRQERTAS